MVPLGVPVSHGLLFNCSPAQLFSRDGVQWPSHMLTETRHLAYAKGRPRWYRRRAARRGILIALFFLTTIGSWRAWRGTPGRWARANYWFWICEHHTEPPDKIVYAYADEEAAAAVTRQGGTQSSSSSHPRQAYAACPPPLLHLEMAIWGGHWDNWDNQTANCFLHDRRAPDGSDCLLSIDTDYDRYAGSPPTEPVHGICVLTVRVLTRNAFPPRRPRAFFYNYELTTDFDKPSLRLYAGQPDPNDPGGVIIPYQLNGQPGKLEFRLPAGYNAFKVLSGPLQVRLRVEDDLM